MVSNAPPELDISNLQINLFKDSKEPFLTLLREHGLEYTKRLPQPGVIMASGDIVEILQAGTWVASLATVICAYLKNRRSRKVIITTKDNKIIHCEGLGQQEIESILKLSKDITVVDTDP